MPERFDAIVIGMGPGGEVAASRLLHAGKRVAVVERELIGGECAYWACIPSKTLLRPPEARSEARRAAGLAEPALDWPGVAAYRDYMIRHLDDSAQVEGYEKQGATVLKGTARITGVGTVEVDGRRLEADHVIVATGSDPVVPPVPGLDQITTWTNREATTLQEVPARAVVLGGGPVGVELGQLLARLGTAVTVVEMADRLMPREAPRVGELVQAALEADGIDVRVGRRLQEARAADGGAQVDLDDATTIPTDVVVIGAGRTPRVGDLGLETVGVETTKGGIPVDDRCRAADGLWAIGDATGVMPFTHVAMYQARVVADNILGKERRANYTGIPRVAFADPEIAAAGLTEEQARDAGMDVATATVSLPDALARPWTYEREPRGELGVVADRHQRVLVGAWAVAPLAGEWIHVASLAIRVAIPIDVLLDTVAQFPTYAEGYLKALERLEP